MSALEVQLKQARNKIDDADQYERKDSVIISGNAVPPMAEEEDTHTLVQKLLKDHFNTDITLRDINTTHRLGPLKASTPTRRNIYVKFVRRDVKKHVIKKSKELGRTTGLYANESLTPLRRTIFNALRKMKADVPDIVKGCYTMEGKIFAFTPPVGNNSKEQRHCITDMGALQAFCRDYVKEPLDTFLQNFST